MNIILHIDTTLTSKPEIFLGRFEKNVKMVLQYDNTSFSKGRYRGYAFKHVNLSTIYLTLHNQSIHPLDFRASPG